MTAASDCSSMEMALGEVRGQLRELIQTISNQGRKIDSIHEKMAPLDSLLAEVADLKSRVALLETERHRRDGAMGLGSALLKSPLVGWFVAAGAAAWAIVTGRMHT